MTKRNFQYDTMKGILILLVLLGHCLEQFKGGEMIYRIIYSFHMPAFLAFCYFDTIVYIIFIRHWHTI